MFVFYFQKRRNYIKKKSSHSYVVSSDGHNKASMTQTNVTRILYSVFHGFALKRYMVTMCRDIKHNKSTYAVITVHQLLIH